MGWTWDLQAPETSVGLVTYSDSASSTSATLEAFLPSAFLSLIQEKRRAGGKQKGGGASPGWGGTWGREGGAGLGEEWKTVWKGSGGWVEMGVKRWGCGGGGGCLIVSCRALERPRYHLCSSLGVVSPQNSYARSQLGRR